MKIKISLIILLLSYTVQGQSATRDYIERWHQVAIREMKVYRIPASITLAQGILESGSGKSYLATEANNHFGIKCHLDWKGRKVYKDDDERDECFRAYDQAEESFRDHSEFLANRSRYAFLFEEELTDYEAWAKGLKKAGYATDRHYPKRLIELIERYELYRFDEEDYQAGDEDEIPAANTLSVLVSANHVDYVVVRTGDTFESIAEATDRKPEELLENNELRFDAQLKEGQIIYLQPKRKRAARKFKTHVVKEGENMYEIAQRYAIRLEKLYERNDLPIGAQPKAGQILELR